MKSSFMVVVAAVVVALVLVAGPAPVAEAVTCDVKELAPCLTAIKTPADPTPECCAKLKEQQPCLCGYLKDPRYGKLITMPAAQKVAKACGIPFPQCTFN